MVLQLVNLEGKEGTLVRDLTLEEWRGLEPSSLDSILSGAKDIPRYRMVQIQTSWKFPSKTDLEEFSRYAEILQPEKANKDSSEPYRYAHLLHPLSKNDGSGNPINIFEGIRYVKFRGWVNEYSVDSANVLSLMVSQSRRRGKKESLDCVCTFYDPKSLERFEEKLEGDGNAQAKLIEIGGFMPNRTGYMVQPLPDYLVVNYLKLGKSEFLTDAYGNLQSVSLRNASEIPQRKVITGHLPGIQHAA